MGTVLACSDDNRHLHVELCRHQPYGPAKFGENRIIRTRLGPRLVRLGRMLGLDRKEHGQHKSAAHDELLDVLDGHGVVIEGREELPGDAGAIEAGEREEKGLVAHRR